MENAAGKRATKPLTEQLAIYNHQVIKGHLTAKQGWHVDATPTQHHSAVISIISSKVYSNAK